MTEDVHPTRRIQLTFSRQFMCLSHVFSGKKVSITNERNLLLSHSIIIRQLVASTRWCLVADDPFPELQVHVSTNHSKLHLLTSLPRKRHSCSLSHRQYNLDNLDNTMRILLRVSPESRKRARL